MARLTKEERAELLRKGADYERIWGSCRAWETEALAAKARIKALEGRDEWARQRHVLAVALLEAAARAHDDGSSPEVTRVLLAGAREHLGPLLETDEEDSHDD